MGYLITFFCQADNHLCSVIACFCEGSHAITYIANKLCDFVLKFLLGLTQYSVMSSCACMWWKGREVVLEKGESPNDPQPKTLRYLIFMVGMEEKKESFAVCVREASHLTVAWMLTETHIKRDAFWLPDFIHTHCHFG